MLKKSWIQAPKQNQEAKREIIKKRSKKNWFKQLLDQEEWKAYSLFAQFWNNLLPRSYFSIFFANEQFCLAMNESCLQPWHLKTNLSITTRQTDFPSSKQSTWRSIFPFNSQEKEDCLKGLGITCFCLCISYVFYQKENIGLWMLLTKRGSLPRVLSGYQIWQQLKEKCYIACFKKFPSKSR